MIPEVVDGPYHFGGGLLCGSLGEKGQMPKKMYDKKTGQRFERWNASIEVMFTCRSFTRSCQNVHPSVTGFTQSKHLMVPVQKSTWLMPE